MLVSPPSPAPPAHHKLLPGFSQVSQQLIRRGIINDRSRWHRDHQVLGAPAGHVAAATVSAVIRDVFLLIAKTLQRV